MRHRINKLKELNTWAKKKEVFLRNLITSFVRDWKIVTTPKRAKVLKSEIDSFFSRLVRTYNSYADEKDSKREAIRLIKSVVFGEKEWKKLMGDILPKYLKEKKTSYVSSYKLWFRKWDAAEKVLLKLV